MKRSYSGLARQVVRDYPPYSSARSLSGDGVSADTVFLDANELPADLDGCGYHRYPAPQPPELVQLFANLYGVSPEQLTIGRGADEGIECLLKGFCEPQADSCIICPPTYGMYAIAARILGVQVQKVPLTADFQVDGDGIAAAVTPTTKLVFLCSPNNPTGNSMAPDRVIQLCRQLSQRCLVVVDEAYGEFAAHQDVSLVPWLSALPNLVLLRTLSKAHGLAGVRCGVTISAPEVAAVLQAVAAPYPLGKPAVAAVLASFQKPRRQLMQETVAGVLARRETFAAALKDLPIVRHVYPSEANFLLVAFWEPEMVFDRCRQAGILVRDQSHAVPQCLRITIGDAREMKRLLTVLQEVAHDGK